MSSSRWRPNEIHTLVLYRAMAQICPTAMAVTRYTPGSGSAATQSVGVHSPLTGSERFWPAACP